MPGPSLLVTRVFFIPMKLNRNILLVLLLCPLSVIAQKAYNESECYRNPLAARVGYLPKEVAGTSSLFWMDGRLWTCNDHGTLKLYALDTLTAAVDTVIDFGVNVYDLEEVALDSLYLYFGDIGDNSGSRTDLRILRLARSDLADGLIRFDTIHFHYPERTKSMARNFDCEAFVVGTDSLYLFTKQWISHGSVCYALPKIPGTYVAERCFTLHTDGLVTAAAYLPEQQKLVLLGYSLTVKPFVYVIDEFEGLHFNEGRHRRTDLANPFVTQSEGIATVDGEHFFLTNETLSFHFLTRKAALLRLDLSNLPEESNIR